MAVYLKKISYEYHFSIHYDYSCFVSRTTEEWSITSSYSKRFSSLDQLIYICT